MASVDSSLVADAVVSLVKTQFDPIPVGDSQPPDLTAYDRDTLAKAVIIVYQIPRGDPYAHRGFSGGQGMELVRFQFTVVGTKANQVRRLSNAIASAVVDRSEVDSSQWVNDIPVAGHAVIGRERIGMIPIDGEGVSIQGGSIVELLVQTT